MHVRQKYVTTTLYTLDKSKRSNTYRSCCEEEKTGKTEDRRSECCRLRRKDRLELGGGNKRAGFTLLFQMLNVGVFTQKTKMAVALYGSANAGSADIGWVSSLPILMQESFWW